MPTNRFTFGTLGGTNPTPPPVDTTTKKKPKYDWEPINDDGSSASFLTGGFLPVLAPTSPVAAGGSAVADAPDVVVITDDEDEEWDEDDTFRRQRPHPLILAHLYNDSFSIKFFPPRVFFLLQNKKSERFTNQFVKLSSCREDVVQFFFLNCE
jgi:hypothetical protein